MKIAAFNAKNLGLKKVTDRRVLYYLIKIMSQYSVVVVLEVRDKSGEAMEIFLQELNKSCCNRNHPFSMTASAQLGRDPYQEQFVCFYREADVTLKTSLLHEDGDPYILRFYCHNTVVKNLVLIPVHTKPDDAEKELDELFDVVQAVRKRWRTTKIMIIGDFNAGGRYLSQERKRKLRICCAPYHWLIKDDVNTTSSSCNDHTYDRIVVFGQIMLKAIVPDSAKVFNFQREFNLTDEETLSISDHYPVEVELKAGRMRRRRWRFRRGRKWRKKMNKKMENIGLAVKREMAAMVSKIKKEESSPTPAKRRRLDKW